MAVRREARSSSRIGSLSIRPAAWILVLSACGAPKGGGTGGAGGTRDTDGSVSPDDSASTDSDSPEWGPGGYEIAQVEAHTFEMGCTAGQGESCYSDELPAHPVTLTHGFWIDKTEVTQAEYARIMAGATPSQFSACGGDCPVEFVTWHMAAAYANARSREEGLSPLYRCEGEGADSTCAPDGDVYESGAWRLPTEAEWEAAARCGKDEKYAGSGAAPYTVAWYSRNSESKTQPVAQLEPNDCGLYDMSGNVREWVHDGYQDYGGAVEDPSGPDEGAWRMQRGGSFAEDEGEARVSNRTSTDQTSGGSLVGFRMVKSGL